jgi:hypothetical protein
MSFEPDPTAQEPPRVPIVASVGSMADIREALRARFETLEISRTTIDEAAGLADGHASKLLAGLTGFGPLTLFPVLEIAGLRLALVDDPAALERAQKLKKRASEQVRHQLAGVTRGMLKTCRPAVMSEFATKGGKARMARLSPAQRSELGRLAAQARAKNRMAAR